MLSDRKTEARKQFITYGNTLAYAAAVSGFGTS